MPDVINIILNQHIVDIIITHFVVILYDKHKMYYVIVYNTNNVHF